VTAGSPTINGPAMHGAMHAENATHELNLLFEIIDKAYKLALSNQTL
jgi:hypothetical protein